MEVRQLGSDQHTGVVLANLGQASLMSLGSGYTVPVLGTRWEVTYWPVPAERSKLAWRSTALLSVFGVAFMFLGLLAYVLYRIFNKSFQADYETILEAFRGIKSGQSNMTDHQFRLRDFQGMSEVLGTLVSTGGRISQQKI